MTNRELENMCREKLGTALTDESIIEYWNGYAEENGYEPIYGMDEFDTIMEGAKPWELARMVVYGDFACAEEYFSFDGYGNIVSFDFSNNPNSPVDFSDNFFDYIREHMSN